MNKSINKKFENLLSLSDQLLGKKGCPWHKIQTIKSLKKFLLEEAQEVICAIDNKDFSNLKEELGDLLYVIIFIIKLAELKKTFDTKDVIDNLHEKLVRRHPHVFGSKKFDTLEDIGKWWQFIKKQEKNKSAGE